MVTKRCSIKDGVITIDKDLIEEKRKANEMIYLSDFLDDIPSRCIFLKGVTGCGATTLALQAGTYNRIIALPTRNTVYSKWVKRDSKTHKDLGYDDSIFCIFGGFNDSLKLLKQYIDRCAAEDMPLKIVCTYDQVERLVMRLKGFRKSTAKEFKESGQKWIQDDSQDALCIDVPSMRLFIDEIHQVLDDYKTPDRRENIKGMLQCIQYFPNTVCITATPLEEKYFFDEIKNLPVIRVKYPIKEKHEIVLRQCQKLGNETLKIVLDHLEDRSFGNAHIFVNSVSSICDILKKLNLAKYGFEIRVVCGNTEVNQDKIRNAITNAFGKEISLITADMAKEADRVISDAISDTVFKTIDQLKELRLNPVSSINDPVRKINFYTRTAWLGADVFDEQAQVYIVSDGAKPHTMADISTAYIQIVGRVRNSNNPRIIHLYKENRYIGTSPEAKDSMFYQNQEDRKKNRAKIEKWFEDDKDLALRVIKREELEAECYLVIDKATGMPIYDKYLEWNDEISNKVINRDYARLANISAALYEKGGFNVEIDKTNLTEQLKKNPTKRRTFEAIFKEYVQLKDSRQESLFPWWEDALQVLEINEPLVKRAYDILHPDGVEKLGYNRREVEREVNIREDGANRRKIPKLLGIKVGQKYTVADLKERCERVKKDLRLNRPIRISDFYDVKNTTIRIAGEVVNARLIVRKHLIK